jgi:Ca2+-binding RTX toxin-like protein
MPKIVFKQAIDLANIDLTNFTGGSLDFSTFSSTYAKITSGDYTGEVTGEGFAIDFSTFEPVGTVHTFTGSFQGSPVIVATRMNLDLNALYDVRDNASALIDLIFGGKDTMEGSSGVDVLYGFGGNDKIDGNKGADILAGGDGRDVFVYDKVSDSSASNADTIVGLSSQDKIDLSKIDGVGADDVTASFSGGVTTFSINTDDDRRAEMKIMAEGDHTDFAGFVFAT